MITLRFATPAAWTEAVINDFDRFLNDHAAAEKKASGMAMAMLSHYPDRAEIVAAMLDLAIEELNHFREVVKIMTAQGIQLAPDEKDSYINDFRTAFRKGSEVYMLDRLLVGGIIEARGCERFGLVAEALEPGPLKDFYAAITASEAKHKDLFVELALEYFEEEVVYQRLDELLDFEAKLVEALPIRSALH